MQPKRSSNILGPKKLDDVGFDEHYLYLTRTCKTTISYLLSMRKKSVNWYIDMTESSSLLGLRILSFSSSILVVITGYTEIQKQ
jgi:hypothetical protein